MPFEYLFLEEPTCLHPGFPHDLLSPDFRPSPRATFVLPQTQRHFQYAFFLRFSPEKWENPMTLSLPKDCPERSIRLGLCGMEIF